VAKVIVPKFLLAYTFSISDSFFKIRITFLLFALSRICLESVLFFIFSIIILEEDRQDSSWSSISHLSFETNESRTLQPIPTGREILGSDEPAREQIRSAAHSLFPPLLCQQDKAKKSFEESHTHKHKKIHTSTNQITPAHGKEHFDSFALQKNEVYFET
jgi:hypothetical protein